MLNISEFILSLINPHTVEIIDLYLPFLSLNLSSHIPYIKKEQRK